ncbi:transposase tnp2 [Pyrus ussuriensis x Pyrus communis]|uniref:Transposase tnp2 n=1 Tax=Pyrus ussuriensis x Pyrus communis TaxID=2448454 RepID=A0A5N5I0M1_9ROSA|nr:transposase tnp2 [Pyrus ussuriensis x Pyrus communis]
MSQLIRTQKAMTSTPRRTTTPTIVATAPAEMDHRPMNHVDPVGPPVPHALASSTSLVALPVSAQRAHHRPCTPELPMP